MKAKIELMLEVYRKKLDEREQVKDHIECVRLQAQISVLEHLYIYALEIEG